MLSPLIQSSFLCVLVTLTSTTAFAASSGSHVDATIIANVNSIKPGQPFEVGVRLKMNPGWHTYWSNPGDAGLPTRVIWTLPPGYSAGELQFPVPTRIDEPGGIVIYGYEKEVMLMARITPPADVKVGESSLIGAKVNWLCCSEVCVPGKARLQLTLPVAGDAAVANRDVFDQWTTHLPKNSDAAVTPLRLDDEHPLATILVGRTIDDEKSVIPGAVDGVILRVDGLQSATREGVAGTLITLSGKALVGQRVKEKSFVVLLTRAGMSNDDRLGEAVTVPIVSQSLVKE